MPVFSKNFEPIAKPSENVCIVGAGGKGAVKYFKVLGIEPLPALIKDFGAITNGTSVTSTVDELYLNKSQLAQYRMKLIDNVVVKIYQPAANTRSATKSGTFTINQNIAPNDSSVEFSPLTEFYIYEDQEIKFEVINESGSDLSSSKILFAGFKYKLKELEEEPDKYTTVYVETL